MTNSFYCSIVDKLLHVLLLLLVVVVLVLVLVLVVGHWCIILQRYIEKVWKHFHINEVIVYFMRFAVR